jgi:hypothetical protein
LKRGYTVQNPKLPQQGYGRRRKTLANAKVCISAASIKYGNVRHAARGQRNRSGAPGHAGAKNGDPDAPWQHH